MEHGETVKNRSGGKVENILAICFIHQFLVFHSGKKWETKFSMISATFIGWFAEFEKTLAIIQR